jgi:4-alpha-glucanotransferase
LKILPQREAGVCLHLTSLPGRFGIGELGGAARRFLDVLQAAGLRVWQFLPVGPTGFGDSPYQTTSVFAGNPLLIDIEALHEQGLVTDTELVPLAALPANRVDFDRLIPLKLQLLARAADRFADVASVQARAARGAFIAIHDATWLHDYALFEVLKVMHQQRAWVEWERAYALRAPDAMRTLEEAAQRQIDSVKTVQFLFSEQWAGLKAQAHGRGIRLMGDVPIYVALDSADAWAHPELFSLGADGLPTEVAGVPPDYFSADGQLWGNPLYRWERHASDGYAWWVARLGHAMRLADLVRLDHFRGFEAFWAVPAESATARGGEWRAGPGAAIFDALRTALGDLPIIAEDLGVITPAVDELRERYALPGMKVLQFMVGEDRFDPAVIPENCVCYTGTHDNDTTVGWFRGAPGDVRTPEEVERMRRNVLRHTQGRSETIHTDLVRLAFATRAALAIAPLQDFLGLDSEARLNTPGTTMGNWRWRVTDSQLMPQICADVRRLAARSGRIPGSGELR